MVVYKTYNITNIPQNFTAIFTQNNMVTDGLFAPFLLLIIFTTTFIILYGRGNENAFMAASWLTTMSAFLLMAFGGLTPFIVLLCTAITVVAIYALPMER